MMASPNAPLGDGAAASGSGSRNRPWYVRFRVFEFLVSLIMCGMAGAFALMKTHMRVIPRVEVVISANLTVYARDPTIDQKKLAEQVPMSALLAAATGIPIVVNLFMNFVLPKFKRIRIIPHDTRDFLLSLCQAVGISQVITHFIKNMAGRFRPSFYDMCKWDYSKVWDGVTNLCQDEKTELEGRRSFPSGHASYAFATLFLLTLYLLGRSRINCENRDETLLRGSRKTFKLFLCFAPTLLAAWVAVTRSVDNWHHYSDILAGSIIGVLAASIGYSYNYGSIFNWEAAGVPYEEAHIRRKKRDRDLAEASLTLLHSSADMHGEPTSHSGASYTTAKTAPASRKNDISIHIQ